MPTKKRLRELFGYRSGELIALRDTRGRRKGRAIGGLNGRYLYAWVDGRYVALHRLIWTWHNGAIPSGLSVDHINHSRFDNRIENLRLATSAENSRNRPPTRSTHHGVYESKGRYRVSIWIGTFDTLEEAVAARRDAERVYNYHPNHGQMVE